MTALAVAFSGEPLTMAPPTLDYGLFQKAIRDEPLAYSKTALRSVTELSLAVRHLRDSKAKSRVIILTDGDNNVGGSTGNGRELAAGLEFAFIRSRSDARRVKLPIRQKGPFGKVITHQWFDDALNPELLEHRENIKQEILSRYG